MIVTAASGYVAGTYISTAAIASILTAATATLGVGVAALTGAGSAIVGSAGIFGTTIGASGVTGALMSAGLLPATPIAVPIAIGGVALAGAYLTFLLLKLKRKLRKADAGEEVQFTEIEAKIIEALIKRLSKKSPEA
jgi:hypothetical protein